MSVAGVNTTMDARARVARVRSTPPPPASEAADAITPCASGDTVHVQRLGTPLAPRAGQSTTASPGSATLPLPMSLLADPARAAARESLEAALLETPRSLLHGGTEHLNDRGHLVCAPAEPARVADIAAREAVIAGMLARGPSRPDAALRQRVQDALSPVPLPVLRTVARAGVVIAVARGAQTPLDAGIIHPLRLPRDLPAVALRRHVERALREADALHGAEVTAHRRALAEHDATVAGATPTLAQKTVRQRLARMLEKAERLHRICANHEMVRRSGGRVRPLRIPLETGQLARPVTVAEVAHLHGARNEEEERVFARLMLALNGERLTHAQDALGSDGGRSAEQRPFPSNTPLIAVPDLHFHRDVDVPDAPVVLLDDHDHRSQQQWSQGQVYGQFFPQARRPVVVLRDDQLGENEYGHSTPVHEVGHAYEWAVETLAPETFAPFALARDATWARLLSEGETRFPSEYAQINPKEMVAESFAEAYGSRPSRLPSLDTRWSETFHAFLEHAEALGGEKPAWWARWLCGASPSRELP